MDQKSNDEKVYYSKCNLMRRGKDAPLEKAVFTVSGEVSFVEKKEGQYGNFLAVTLTAVLPDKSVERHFGPELVNPEHKVEFRFLLSGFYAELFERYTPRWGQDIILKASNVEVVSSDTMFPQNAVDTLRSAVQRRQMVRKDRLSRSKGRKKMSPLQMLTAKTSTNLCGR